MKYYLGIDESNHGRFPEFFVGVLSTRPGESEPWHYDKTVAFTPKIRRQLNKLDFASVIFHGTDADIYGREEMSLVAYAELIRHFSKSHDLKSVLIDKRLRERQQSELERLLWTNRVPNIVSGDHFDETFEIVNDADSLARMIRRDWIDRKDNKNNHFERYKNKFITPDIEFYRQRLKGSMLPDMRKKKHSNGFIHHGGRRVRSLR